MSPELFQIQLTFTLLRIGVNGSNRTLEWDQAEDGQLWDDHRYFLGLSFEMSLKSLAKEILSPCLSCLSKRQSWRVLRAMVDCRTFSKSTKQRRYSRPLIVVFLMSRMHWKPGKGRKMSSQNEPYDSPPFLRRRWGSHPRTDCWQRLAGCETGRQTCSGRVGTSAAAAGSREEGSWCPSVRKNLASRHSSCDRTCSNNYIYSQQCVQNLGINRVPGMGVNQGDGSGRKRIKLSLRLLHIFYYNSWEMEIGKAEAQSANYPIPQRSRFQFSEPREPEIFFSSQFDSGNMNRVVRTAYDHYSIWTACDAQGTDNEGYPKSWFYFRVGGFSNRRVTFSVHRVHFLFAMAKRHQLYRPVYRIRYQNEEVTDWDRLPYPVLGLALNQEEQLVLKFDFMFNKLISSVQFAFTYPYSYQQCMEDIEHRRQQHHEDQQLFFGHYQLTRSYEGRSIPLIIISSHEGREGFEITKGLPFSDQKIVRFRTNKPIIFVSARVHPIETPSSYTMNGVISFLLDKKDMRAHLLRKYFVFVLVPMLNPDGVARGHCRMDALNQNLNRYYSNPDPDRQPSCFAVKKLCEHYCKQKRMFMYLDLHAHPALKGNFIFGNAIYEFIEQVESQLYAKVLSQNCINFQFEQCIFSRKHMKAKDRNEDISKEGCARVVFYKEFGLVHSYTLECGYHLNSYDNLLSPPTNSCSGYMIKYKLNQNGHKLYEGCEKGLEQKQLEKYAEEMEGKEDPKCRQYDLFEFTEHELDNKEGEYYKRQLPSFGQETFHNLGRNILISLLDIWNKNPYSRIPDIGQDRKQIAERQAKLDRFRKEQAGIKTKQKKIVQLIEEQLYGKWHRRNVFNPLLANPTREKKRNHTLQVQRVGFLRQQKQEKQISEKVVPKQLPSHQLSDTPEGENFSHVKIPLVDQSDKADKDSETIPDSKMYYSRNFKMGRGKQTSSANQGEKEVPRAPSINKELLATQIKVTLDDELLRAQKHEGLSLSSKIIRNPAFNLNMRVRNVVLNGIAAIPKK